MTVVRGREMQHVRLNTHEYQHDEAREEIGPGSPGQADEAVVLPGHHVAQETCNTSPWDALSLMTMKLNWITRKMESAGSSVMIQRNESLSAGNRLRNQCERFVECS